MITAPSIAEWVECRRRVGIIPERVFPLLFVLRVFPIVAVQIEEALSGILEDHSLGALVSRFVMSPRRRLNRIGACVD